MARQVFEAGPINAREHFAQQGAGPEGADSQAGSDNQDWQKP